MSEKEDTPPVISEPVARAKTSERKPAVLAMPLPVQQPPPDASATLAMQAAHAVQAAKAAQAVQAAHMQVQAAQAVQAVQVQYPAGSVAFPMAGAGGSFSFAAMQGVPPSHPCFVQMAQAPPQQPQVQAPLAPPKAKRKPARSGEPRKRNKVAASAPAGGEGGGEGGGGGSGGFPCTSCERVFESQPALSGHHRFCTGGAWRCDWCSCEETQTPSKAHGPDGPKTLCNACGSRYRAGHTSMPERDEQGRYLCPNCQRAFGTIGALGGHRRFCDKGDWACAWCTSTYRQCAGKVGPGPTGPQTLCSACSARFRNGHTGPPEQNEEGKFVCPECQRGFESIGALGGHRRFCDAGVWRCEWCEVRAEECSGKGPGPEGPKTLCSACSARFRAGHTAAPRRDARGNFMCDSCGRAFVSMGALGGHRRFCTQLSTAAPPRVHLREDTELSDEDGGAKAVALPRGDDVLRRLPEQLHGSLLSSYDFLRYFYRAVAPRVTLLDVSAALLRHGEGGTGLLPPPPEPPQARAAANLVPPPERVGPGPRSGVRKSKKLADAAREAQSDPSEVSRRMLRVLQAASLHEWEAVLVSPATERPPLLHALHVLTTQLLVVDLLSPSAVLPGNRFCASLIEALAAKLPHCPVNAYSWPEMLRMVLLARAVGQARKKRSVAINAMISAGIGSVVVATAAAAALGGGHAVSVWSAGSAADEVDADEDGGGAQGGTNDWAHVCDALAGDVEYEDLDVSMRCQVLECVSQLLTETALAGRFFETSQRAAEKLSDLKRSEYKVRNAQIEKEEQAKLAEKYQIARPAKLSHTRVHPRQNSSSVGGADSPLSSSTPRAGTPGLEGGEGGEEEGEAARDPTPLGTPVPGAEGGGEAAAEAGGEEAEAVKVAETAEALETAETLEPMEAAEPAQVMETVEEAKTAEGAEAAEGAETAEGVEGAEGAEAETAELAEAAEAAEKEELGPKGGKKQQVRRGDLDAMRLRKDELRKQLDTDFAVLAGRVGRARQEPLGLDRDWREYYLLGGPAEGQQPTAELGVLWVRARAARASSACPAETWRGVSSPEQLQALLDSLRVQGEREHQLSKTLTELQPLLVAAMQRDAATAAAGGVVADGSPPAEVEEPPTTNGGEGSGAGGAEEDAEAPEQAGEAAAAAAAAAATTASGGDGVDGAAVAAALATPTWRLWETGGWQSRATKHIERTLSESTRRQHRDSGGAGDAAAPRVGRALLQLKRELIDLFVAVPAAGLRCKDAEFRTGFPASIRRATAVRELNTQLLALVARIPREQLRRGFRPWWHAEGEKPPTVPATEVDSVHQVLLHLHILDTALVYGARLQPDCFEDAAVDLPPRARLGKGAVRELSDDDEQGSAGGEEVKATKASRGKAGGAPPRASRSRTS